jgi:hypothetical protein
MGAATMGAEMGDMLASVDDGAGRHRRMAGDGRMSRFGPGGGHAVAPGFVAGVFLSAVIRVLSARQLSCRWWLSWVGEGSVLCACGKAWGRKSSGEGGRAMSATCCCQCVR